MNMTQQLISHHPSEATLLAYAAGSLDEGSSVVIAAHLGACPACRTDVQVCEAVGGHLLATQQGTAMASDALDRALARLDTPAAFVPQPPPVNVSLGFTLPHALSPYSLKNWRWIAPGIRFIMVMPRKSGRSGLHLLRISPGAPLPEHGHNGTELTCILAGSYTDETGQFRAGDIAEMDTHDEHMPLADPGQDCICLTATDAKLRFSSLLPRLLQPIMGF